MDTSSNLTRYAALPHAGLGLLTGGRVASQRVVPSFVAERKPVIDARFDATGASRGPAWSPPT